MIWFQTQNFWRFCISLCVVADRYVMYCYLQIAADSSWVRWMLVRLSKRKLHQWLMMECSVLWLVAFMVWSQQITCLVFTCILYLQIDRAEYCWPLSLWHLGWLGGVVVSMSHSWSSGLTPGRRTARQQLWPCAPVTKQYNLVPAKGKVTVDLALHWPCITDFCGLSTYGDKATER